MKFSPLWYIIFGLTAIIILLLLFQPKPDNSKEKELEAKIDSREQAILQLHRESLKQAEKIKADSFKQAHERTAYQRTIKKHVAVIANLRANPIVIKIREETPEVDSLLDVMEAKDSIRVARIDTLESSLKELRVDMSGLTFTFEQRLDLQAETIADLRTLTEDQRKQLRRSRRTVKVLKVLTVVGTVGGLFLGATF